MKKEQGKGLPAEVERVRERLEKWRAGERRGGRIPEKLWEAAARAARRHGVSGVCRALGLDYNGLRRRSELIEEEPGKEVSAEGLFVELAPMRRAEGAGCVLELQKGNGAKLRISVSDAATVDWCRVKEAFLGA